MKYLIGLIVAASLPAFGAESTNAPIKAELDSVAEAQPMVSAVQIVQRLRREGDGWLLNEPDRERLSITLTNQQGKVCAGPMVAKLAPYGLLLEHDSSAFWCGWAELPLATREKYQAIAARAPKNQTSKTIEANPMDRIQAKAVAEEATKRRKKEEHRATASEQQKKNAAEARLSKFKPLLNGKPVSGLEYVNYLDAWEAVEQVAKTGDLIRSKEAREILSLSDEITQMRVEGRSTIVEADQTQIIERLNRLLDAGALH